MAAKKHEKGPKMAIKEETKLARRWDKKLKETFGIDIEIENIQQTGKIGTPDRLICLRGLHVALEYKTDVGKPSKIQLLKLGRYKRAKGYAAIVTPDTFELVLEELKELYYRVIKSTFATESKPPLK